jgi:hypothetical protein
LAKKRKKPHTREATTVKNTKNEKRMEVEIGDSDEDVIQGSRRRSGRIAKTSGGSNKRLDASERWKTIPTQREVISSQGRSRRNLKKSMITKRKKGGMIPLMEPGFLRKRTKFKPKTPHIFWQPSPWVCYCSRYP